MPEAADPPETPFPSSPHPSTPFPHRTSYIGPEARPASVALLGWIGLCAAVILLMIGLIGLVGAATSPVRASMSLVALLLSGTIAVDALAIWTAKGWAWYATLVLVFMLGAVGIQALMTGVLLPGSLTVAGAVTLLALLVRRDVREHFRIGSLMPGITGRPA